MSRLLDPVEIFPTELRGFRLLQEIGDGYSSHIFLAEPPMQNGGALPNKVALKLATSDSHWTDEDTLAQFATERAIMSSLASPFLVRGWPDSIEGDDILIMEVGVCSLAELEMAAGPSQIRGVNKLPEIFVKYLSARILLGLVAPHAKGYSSGDLKVENALLMPDFSTRLIDMCGGREKQGMDIQHLAALMLNASVGKRDCSRDTKQDLLKMLSSYGSSLPTSLASLLFDMLDSMLSETSSRRSIDSFLGHRYWSGTLAGYSMAESSLDLNDLVAGKELNVWDDMRKAAYLSLPPHLRDWLASRTVACSYVA